MEQVATELGLIRRGNVWAYRRRIPVDLLAAFEGKKELKRSLGTGEIREAKARRNRLANEWDRLFERKRDELRGARSRPPKRLASLTVSEMETLIRQYVTNTTTKQLQEVQAGRFVGIDDFIDDVEAQALHNIRSLEDPAEAFTEPCYYERSREIFRDYKDAEKRLSPQDRVYVEDFIRRAALEIERRRLAYIREHRADQTFDNAFSGPTERIVTLQEMADEYLAEHAKIKKVGTKRRHMLGAAVKLVLDFFGSQLDVKKIDQRHCREFRDVLNQLPSNMRKHFPDDRLSLREIMAETKRRNLPLMMRGTQSKYVHALRDVLGWAVSERHIPFNPGQEIKALGKKTPPKQARDAFDIGDLIKIFTCPLYLSVEHDSHRFWVPLIALFTGMRENEICQLDVADVCYSQLGTAYFDVNENGNGKRLKNARSARKIPVHSELSRIGFLRFVEARAVRSRNAKLFPELKLSRHGYYAERFSRWANETLFVQAGVKTLLKNVHSFRHTVKDALERAEVPFHVTDAIGGWNTVVKGASVNYGSGPTVEELVRYVERLRYPRLDLSHLYDVVE